MYGMLQRLIDLIVVFKEIRMPPGRATRATSSIECDFSLGRHHSLHRDSLLPSVLSLGPRSGPLNTWCNGSKALLSTVRYFLF